MAETSIPVNTSTDPAAPKIAVDRIGSDNYQIVKIAFGIEGIADDVEDGKPFPVDTSLEGLLGAILAALPAALTALGALKTGPAEGVATQTVVVGQTVATTGVDTAGMRNLGLQVPSNFDGSTLTFQVATTLGGTYQDLRDITDTPVTLPVTLSKTYDIPGELTFARFIKIVCGTVQAGSDTTFTWIYRS